MWLEAQNLCDASTYSRFLEQAQSLGPEAETLGRQILACPRDDYRQAAVFWMSFVYSMQSKAASIRELGRALPASGAGDEKVRVLYKAWQGDISDLANRVRIGQIGYIDDPKAVLVLARNFIRFEQYADGLNIYQQLITMQDSYESNEVERLYALIWSRDNEGALVRIANMKRFELSTYLREAVERAEILLGKSGHRVVKDESEQRSAWLSLAAKDWVDRPGYRRRSLETEYFGLLHLAVGAHEFSHPLETVRKREASLQLGYDWQILSPWHLIADLGYFTAGLQNFTGRLETSLKFGEFMQLGFGARREPVALIERPLVIPAAGLMRSTGKVDLSLWQRLFINASLAQDGEDAPFANYQSELRLGQLVTGQTEQGIGFFIPLDFIEHPKPAANTTVYPREIRAGVGVRAAYGDGQIWHVSGETRLTTFNRTYFDRPLSYRKLLGAALRVEAKYYVERSWFVFVEGERSFVERNPGEAHDQNQSLVALGVALTSHSQAASLHVKDKE